MKERKGEPTAGSGSSSAICPDSRHVMGSGAPRRADPGGNERIAQEAAAVSASRGKCLPEAEAFELLRALAALAPLPPRARRVDPSSSRCKAAYLSGSRCPRRAAVWGMCRKCFRRGAPMWTGESVRCPGVTPEGRACANYSLPGRSCYLHEPTTARDRGRGRR